jgi:thiol-disulfide isomerase/thioredoxin
MTRTSPALPALLLFLFAACGGPDVPSAPPVLTGDWRAVLESPGGELPFGLRIWDSEDGLNAVARTAGEEAPFSSVERKENQVVLRFDWYDSEITATWQADGSLAGEWRKTIPGGDSRLPFRAVRGSQERFASNPENAAEVAAETALPSLTGSWVVEFKDEDGSEPAQGEFQQDGKTVVGTFLTPTGDYRYLEGTYDGGLLRLSTFDGAHAFLFQARVQDDGSLAGDFWSRDSYHATWTAHPRTESDPALPDAWAQVGLVQGDGVFRFQFPDLEGRPLSLQDERFRGKVVLVNIFGSWCPNCNDEAPVLARLYRHYRDQGLEVVGLAYEFSGEPRRDTALVRLFRERHRIEYPLALAGISDKAAASQTLPDLTAVLSFPTTVFVGRDGRVRRIHSGFSGPGTGEHYDRLVADFEGLVEELLAEKT